MNDEGSDRSPPPVDAADERTHPAAPDSPLPEPRGPDADTPASDASSGTPLTAKVKVKPSKTKPPKIKSVVIPRSTSPLRTSWRETDAGEGLSGPFHENHTGPIGVSQVAALPVRAVDGRLEVCLITTRETHRWTIPKGWPMPGRKDHRAAALEAEQEAGLKGRIGKTPIGTYLSFKRQETHFDLVTITVYRLEVTRTLKDWREKGQRQVRWIPPDLAFAMVEETGLQAIIAGLVQGRPDDGGSDVGTPQQVV